MTMLPLQSLARTDYQGQALAEALLPGFKLHARIEDPNDDVQATDILAAAIGYLEGILAICMAPATYLWMPYPGVTTDAWDRYPWPPTPALAVPVRGVQSLVASRGGTDVSSEYTVLGPADFYGEVRIVHAMPGVVGGDAFTIVAGIKTDDPSQQKTLDPALRTLVYRLGAHFWEHRESVGDFQSYVAPDWINEALMPWWTPRC